MHTELKIIQENYSTSFASIQESAIPGWLNALSYSSDFFIKSNPLFKQVRNKENISPTSLTLSKSDLFNSIIDYAHKPILTTAPFPGIDILIHGSGPAGLANAITFKKLNKNKEIAIYEKRNNKKQLSPFTRQWLTNIPLRTALNYISPGKLEEIAKIGSKGYIGLHLNHFQGIMAQYAEELGIHFINDIKDLAPTFVIDATGGRIHPPPQEINDNNRKKKLNLNFDNGGYKISGYDDFGQLSKNSKQLYGLEIANTNDGYLIPLYNNYPIKTAMLKLYGINQNNFTSLFEKLRPWMERNRIYLWPGTLRDVDNELLIFIDMYSDEFHSIYNSITSTCYCKEARDIFAKRLGIKNDITQIVENIIKTVKDSHPILDKPFIWSPFYQTKPVKINKDHIYLYAGDSFFNGHPKVGNGLSQHLNKCNKIYIQARNTPKRNNTFNPKIIF